MISAIILAAGKGTRINSKKHNKVTLTFAGKPMVVYGVELLESIASPIVVVVGAFSESVREALKGKKVVYANQRLRLGTGHAVAVGLKSLKKKSPGLVLVGYGDHMMFYRKANVEKLIKLHQKEKAVVSLFTTTHENPDALAWGRIIRNKKDLITGIVEQKDATPEERKIKELNTGFYCFDEGFLQKNIKNLQKSPVSGEYYLTDMIKLAVDENQKVVGLKIPFREVGIGVNRQEELEAGQELFLKRRS